MIYPTSSERSNLKPNQEAPFKQIQTNNNKHYLRSKRMLDFVLSLLAIIILSPLFVLIAFIIKVEDRKGPVFFKQIRVGKDGKEFYIYKFRSMVTNAEELKVLLCNQNEATGPVFKMKKDPRVTKFGRFLRRTSLDELPQLLNVLKGDMSLVGPRPPLPDEVKKYNSYERQRLSVTPGLTCYWQVSGRSNIGFNQWVELDLKYIEERNFWIDIKLIFKTIFVLFGSKDAY